MGQRRKKRIFFWRFFGDFSILAFWSFASLLFHFFFLVCVFGSSVAPDSCLYVALLRLFLRLIVWQQIQKQVLAQSHQKTNSAFDWGASPPTAGSATLKRRCSLILLDGCCCCCCCCVCWSFGASILVPWLSLSSNIAMILKFYQVRWTLRSFLCIQTIVTYFIVFSVLSIYVWRKGSLTGEMSTKVCFE